eukprot:1341613-Rhodomonas_salina.2
MVLAACARATRCAVLTRACGARSLRRCAVLSFCMQMCGVHSWMAPGSLGTRYRPTLPAYRSSVY